MSDSILVIPGRIDDRDDLERARGLRAAACFWQMLAAAKAQLGAVDWYALGLAEAEAALAAWESGGQHGFFRVWQERKAIVGGNRPPPSAHELRARRMVILFCVVLERGGLNRRAARKFAARELERAGVFAAAVAPDHRALAGRAAAARPRRRAAARHRHRLLRGRPAAPPGPVLRRAGAPRPQPDNEGRA
jgi:hypothetical protein